MKIRIIGHDDIMVDYVVLPYQLLGYFSGGEGGCHTTKKKKT